MIKQLFQREKMNIDDFLFHLFAVENKYKIKLKAQ